MAMEPHARPYDNGTLDREEVEGLLKRMGKTDDLDMEPVWPELDQDANGTVDLAEFTTWYKKQEESEMNALLLVLDSINIDTSDASETESDNSSPQSDAYGDNIAGDNIESENNASAIPHGQNHEASADSFESTTGAPRGDLREQGLVTTKLSLFNRSSSDAGADMSPETVLQRPPWHRSEADLQLLLTFFGQSCTFINELRSENLRLQVCRELLLTEVPAGVTVFGQGDEGDLFYVIIRGSVKLLCYGEEISTLGPRESFGELSLTGVTSSERQRATTVVTTADTLFATLDRSQYRKLVEGRSTENIGSIVGAELHKIANSTNGEPSEAGDIGDAMRQRAFELAKVEKDAQQAAVVAAQLNGVGNHHAQPRSATQQPPGSQTARQPAVMEPEQESDSPTFLDLPPELFQNIGRHLPPSDVLSLYTVCKESRRDLRTIQADAVSKLTQQANLVKRYHIHLADTEVDLKGKLKDPLDIVCKALSLLPALQHLCLQDNQLTELPESLGNLRGMKMLLLGDNKLTRIPESMGNLQSLRRLYLQNNRLTALPESIGNLRSLQILYLQNNQLTAIPESFGNLHDLRTLFLDSNQLTAIPESVVNLQEVRQVDLRDNQLTNPDQNPVVIASRIYLTKYKV